MKRARVRRLPVVGFDDTVLGIAYLLPQLNVNPVVRRNSLA